MQISTGSIAQWLAQGAAIFALIQGLKNLFPTVFQGKVAQILAAIGALLTSLIPCITSGSVDFNCIAGAVVTFLTAIGVYHSVSQSGGAVNPPLPSAPAAPPK